MAFDNFHSFAPYKHVFICSVTHSNLEWTINILLAGLLDWSTQHKVAGLDWFTRKSSGITKIAGLSARFPSTNTAYIYDRLHGYCHVSIA